MRKIVLLLVMAVGLYAAAIAQPKSITGRVVDKDGKPVSGASILVKGVTKGIADENGNFKLVVKPGEIVTVSSVNGKKDFKVTSSPNYSIELEEVQMSVPEVVVTTAFGVKRAPKEFGGALSVVSNKVLTQGKAVNVQQALNGKVSGLNISTTNSGVFESSKINIRGIRSLTGNNQPMLVVDGAPTPLSVLSTISPDDVQDITVLKSAASASIYGPDGVNGVIIVTTKKGTKRPSFNFSSTVQLTRVAYFPKLQRTFGAGAGEEFDQYGNYLYVPYENQQFGPAFDGSIRDIGIQLEDGSIQRGKYSDDHYKDKVKFWNSGLTVQNAFSVSGEDFYFGVQDANIKGITPDDKNRRTSFRFNGSKKYNNFSINYGVNYTLQNFDILNERGMARLSSTAYTGGIFNQILNTPNNVPLLDYKDWQNNKFAQYSNYYNEFGINPYWAIGNLRSKGRQDNILGNFDLNYQIQPWLKATVRFSTSLGFQNNTNSVAPIVVSDWAVNVQRRSGSTYSNKQGSFTSSQSTGTRVNVDYLLSGEKNINKDIKVKYIVGGLVRENTNKDISIGANALIVPYLYNVSVLTGNAVVNESAIQNSTPNYQIKERLLSAYSSLSVGYKGWANLELTARNDWDSRLLPNNRSFFYPGLNGSLILSDAIDGLKNISALSLLKLRGALSKSGNVNIDPYALQATYSQGTGFPYGNTAGFSANNTIPSSDLKPEFTFTREIGIEIGLLRNRVTLEGTYYYQNNTNQILNVTQSPATGFTTGLKNAADFKNYGVEIDLGLTPLIKINRKADIDLKINATYNQNEVTKTFGNAPVVIGGSSGFISSGGSSPTVNNIAVVGLPAFAFQLTDYKRDPASGKVIVDKLTGYPSIANELVIKGRSLPTWIIGFTPTFKYSDFSLSMTWEYKGGHDFYSGLGPDGDFSGINARTADFGRQRFVFPNSVYFVADEKGSTTINNIKGDYVKNDNIQVADGNYGFWASESYNLGIGTNYFSKAAAWRLRELNMSYNLPLAWLGAKNPFKKITVSAIGRNLLLLVPKSNQWGDPEFNYSSSNNTFGISSSFQSPSSRFFGGTVSFQF